MIIKKITIVLDEKMANWVRIRAAERKISIYQLVGELLREKMQEDEGYLLAKEHFLAQEPKALKKSGTSYPKREKLYER